MKKYNINEKTRVHLRLLLAWPIWHLLNESQYLNSRYPSSSQIQKSWRNQPLKKYTLYTWRQNDLKFTPTVLTAPYLI